MRRGFTLLELAVVIVFSGLIAGVILKTTYMRGSLDCYASTKKQLNAIKVAMDRYTIKHERLPMPAARNIGPDDGLYGSEATPSATDQTAGVTFGALPFHTLKLPSSYASDCWGNKFTYMVTTSLASGKAYSSGGEQGKLTVRSSPSQIILAKAAYAVISHGEDGEGAVSRSYSGFDRKWCLASAGLRTDNCDITNTNVMAAQFNDGDSAGNNYFDDLILFAAKSEISIDGGWSDWGPCTGSCGSAVETRSCTNPAPIAGGADCIGPTSRSCVASTCSGGGKSAPLMSTPVDPAAGSGAALPIDPVVAGGTPIGTGSPSPAPVDPIVVSSGGAPAPAPAASTGPSTSPDPGASGSCSYTGDLSWGAGCTASYSGTIPKGSSASASNTASGYTGSISYSCTDSGWVLISDDCNATTGGGGGKGGKPAPAPGVGGSVAVVHGGWTDWTSCSTSCGTGIQLRTCTNPTPSGGGLECTGPDTQSCTDNSGCSCSFSGTLNWGAGCSADYSGSIPVGKSASAPNTAPGYKGSVTYKCTSSGWVQTSESCKSAL